MMEIDERSVSDRLKALGSKIVRSSFFSDVLCYFEIKDLMKLQQLNKFSYDRGIPRALYICPIIFKQPFGVDRACRYVVLYNADLKKV